MSEPQSLRADVAAVLERGMAPLPDDEFNTLALRVFRFQFHDNPPYRKYCERRIANVNDVARWQDIPAVPTAAFKEATLVCGDSARAQAVFLTSGTTRGTEKRGAHHVLDLELYRLSLLPPFAALVLENRAPMPILSLVTDAAHSPESSLSYMVSTVMRELGTADSRYAIDANGLLLESAFAWIERRIAAAEPACIVGTSLAFLHWFDALQSAGKAYVLPAGSRVMDTGGFKGSNRAIGADELRALYTRLLGVPAASVVNEYGMTEMLSQFYDAGSIKRGPPWVRSMVVDPDTLQELPDGQTGLLRHIDLANLFSVSAIQTEDLGRRKGAGFELLGRVAHAMPRGCSIAMDIFLSSTR